MTMHPTSEHTTCIHHVAQTIQSSRHYDYDTNRYPAGCIFIKSRIYNIVMHLFTDSEYDRIIHIHIVIILHLLKFDSTKNSYLY